MRFHRELWGSRTYREPEQARLTDGQLARRSVSGMIAEAPTSAGSERLIGIMDHMSVIDHGVFSDELVAFIRAEVAVGDYPLEADTDLVLTGLVDSLGIVLVVEWIESRLGVMIDPGDIVIEHFDMVASMVTYLLGRGDTPLD